MRHNRQKQLCSDLQSNRHRGILKYFALELDVPLESIQSLNKAQLCGLITRQIVFKDYDATRFAKDKLKIMEVASKYGIDTSRSFDNVLSDLGKMFNYL